MSDGWVVFPSEWAVSVVFVCDVGRQNGIGTQQ